VTVTKPDVRLNEVVDGPTVIGTLNSVHPIVRAIGQSRNIRDLHGRNGPAQGLVATRHQLNDDTKQCLLTFSIQVERGMDRTVLH
jgi:hypothetical protein